MGLRWSWNDGWLLNMDEVLETDLASFRDDLMGCKDGSKSFPREHLNDEPGTSACPASKYDCRSIGSAPKSEFASRVNDGICGSGSNCCDGSDEKRAICANTCGGAVKESSGNLKEARLDQSAILNTDDSSEAVPDQQEKKIGEDLVSKLKGVTQNFFSCWKSNFYDKVICMRSVPPTRHELKIVHTKIGFLSKGVEATPQE